MVRWACVPGLVVHARRFNTSSCCNCSQARDATASAIDARGAGGLETPMGGATTDLTAIGAGRNTVVQVRGAPAAAGACWVLEPFAACSILHSIFSPC